MAVVTTEHRKKRPASIRLTQAEVAQIERAARRCGVSLAEFVREAAVREAAVRAAEELIMGRPYVSLSAESFAGFMAEISAPAAPVPEVVDLFRRSAPWDS